MRLLPYLLLVFLIYPLLAQQEKDLNKEICDDMLNVEKDLDSIVKVIHVRYRTDSLFLNKFEISQRIWKKYMESQIEMKFPAKDKYYEYGELYPTCFCLEKIRITEQRIEELKIWVTGIIEGPVCPGSTLLESR